MKVDIALSHTRYESPAGTVGALDVVAIQRASSLDPVQNLASLDSVVPLATGESAATLVVLPEGFQRDFGRPDQDLGEFAEPLDGPFVTRLTQLARMRAVTIVAGMFEESGDERRPFNTLVVVGAEGLLATYRKIHLYDSFGYRESDRLMPGPVEPVTLDLNGWRIGLATCYDLRFPELTRALVDKGAQVVVLPAAWVAGRTESEHRQKLDHWTTLARARAIENTCYMVAVGQPGPLYRGHSLIVGPTGTVLAEGGDDDAVLSAQLDPSTLAQARETNPALANRRM